MSEEIWKPMKYCDGHEISNFGNVKRLAHDVVIKGKRNRKRHVRHYDDCILSSRMTERYDGSYPTGKFYKEARVNGGCSISIAESVLQSFKNIPVYDIDNIIYKDGNPENCNLDNLDYDFSKDKPLNYYL